METLLVTLIVMSIVLFGIPLIVQSYLRAQDTLAESWVERQQVEEERTRTNLLVVEAQANSSSVDLTIRNAGSTKLADYQDWDVILHYRTDSSYLVEWVPYEELAVGQERWELVGIYLDAAQSITEEYEPGILNPGEELVLRGFFGSPAQGDTAGLAAVIAPNGVGVSTTFAVAN